MPVVHTIEPGLVQIKLIGKYTFEESLDAIEKATQDKEFENGMCLLLNIAESDETRTSYEMEELAEKIGSLRLVIGKRVALFVRQAHHYGLARMHSTFGKRFGMEYAVFVSLDDAKEWLRQE